MIKECLNTDLLYEEAFGSDMRAKNITKVSEIITKFDFLMSYSERSQLWWQNVIVLKKVTDVEDVRILLNNQNRIRLWKKVSYLAWVLPELLKSFASLLQKTLLKRFFCVLNT